MHISKLAYKRMGEKRVISGCAYHCGRGHFAQVF